MLLNLSHHKQLSWSKEQLHAAETEFGRVVDFGFPQISPEAGSEDIELLAREYAGHCRDAFDRYGKEVGFVAGEQNAVHIMGEQTFCFTLITKLKQAGIRCIASTTKRIVEMMGSEKVSKFEFCRFRDY